MSLDAATLNLRWAKPVPPEGGRTFAVLQRTPPRAPTANSVAERIVRTIRSECLDHLIVIDECHLRAVLAEFADYYNRDRPHRSLRLKTPLPSPVLVRGRVVSRPVLGGLHHVYARAA